MKLQMFSIRDRQVGAFMSPFFQQSEGAALRGFADEVNRAAPDNILYRHPDDFELFYLGTFNSEDGSFELFEVKRLVVTGSSVKVVGGGDPRQTSLIGSN